MITERQYWNIYAEYAQLQVVFGERIIKWLEKNPVPNPEELKKQYEFLHKIEFLSEIFQKQYHFMMSREVDQIKVYEERKRMLKEIARLTNENKILKENINL